MSSKNHVTSNLGSIWMWHYWCVCACTYTHACVNIYMWLHVYGYMCGYTYVCMCMCIQVCVYTYVWLHVYRCICICKSRRSTSSIFLTSYPPLVFDTVSHWTWTSVFQLGCTASKSQGSPRAPDMGLEMCATMPGSSMVLVFQLRSLRLHGKHFT